MILKPKTEWTFLLHYIPNGDKGLDYHVASSQFNRFLWKYVVLFNVLFNTKKTLENVIKFEHFYTVVSALHVYTLIESTIQSAPTSTSHYYQLAPFTQHRSKAGNSLHTSYTIHSEVSFKGATIICGRDEGWQKISWKSRKLWPKLFKTKTNSSSQPMERAVITDFFLQSCFQKIFFYPTWENVVFFSYPACHSLEPAPRS